MIRQLVYKLGLARLLRPFRRQGVSKCDTFDVPPLAAHVERSVPIFDWRQIVSTSAAATPQTVEHGCGESCVRLLRDVVVWPNSSVVATPDGCAASESAFDPHRWETLWSRKHLRCFPIKEIDDWCTSVYGAVYWDNYYHFVVDMLPRLYALHHPEFRKLGRIRLLHCRNDTPDEARLFSALMPEGVDVERVPADLRVRAERFVFLPYLSGTCAGSLPQEYVQWFRSRAFAAFAVPPSSHRERIYISRAGAKMRRIRNEVDLMEALAQYGFKAYELETMGFADQMALFRGAQYVVGAHGAGLTNLIYADHCSVVEVFSGGPKSHYRLLAASLGHSYANVCGTSPEKNADFHVDVAAVIGRLESLGLSARA